MLTAPVALAQDNGSYDNGYERPAESPEVVTVTAPSYQRIPGPTGEDIVAVSESREVRIDDLDLNTAWGRDELRMRVGLAASGICSELLSIRPAGASGSPPCYEGAVNGSIHRARFVVRDAYYRPSDYF
jgi:UrcA family protein